MASQGTFPHPLNRPFGGQKDKAMKATALILMTLLVWAPMAAAENIGTFFGAMATAQATGQGQTTLNGTIGLADVTTYVGGLGYGFTDKMDGRIRIGALDESGFDTAIVLGGDLRWQLWDRDQATGGSPKPFDFAVGGFMEWSDWDAEEFEPFTTSTSMRVLEIGFQTTGSRTFLMSNGSTLTPYGRLNIRHENLSITIEDSGFPGGEMSGSDSQIALGANAGVAWGVSDHFVLMGELQIDGNDGLFLGMNYHP
jgi:hypothetical protein